jgi:hypothetical protein
MYDALAFCRKNVPLFRGRDSLGLPARTRAGDGLANGCLGVAGLSCRAKDQADAGGDAAAGTWLALQ